MFLALHEMRRLVGRFVLLSGAIALLVVLLLFFQSVASALTTGLTGGVDQNQADVLVYSDKARDNPAASFLTANAVDAVAKIDGVSKASGAAQTVLTAEGTKSDITIIGLEDPSFGGPRTLADGRRPNAAGEALASTPGLSSGSVTFRTGDTVTIEGVKLSVVGTADNAAFNVGPTLYVTFDDYQAMTDHHAGTQLPKLLSWVAVKVADGAAPAQVAKSITTQATFDPAAGITMPAGVGGGPPVGVGGGSPPGAGPDGSTPPDDSAPDDSIPSSASTAPGGSVASTPDQRTDTPSSVATEASEAPQDTAPGSTSPDSATGNSVATSIAQATDNSTLPGSSVPGSSVPGASEPGGPPPGVGAGGPPAGVADSLANMSGGVSALDRSAAAAKLPGVGQITQSFNILYLLLFIVVTIVTGVFFLILTVQKQNSLVLMRALGATKSDAVRPVLVEVVLVVGLGSVAGVAIAAGLLYLARDSFGSSLSPVTTVLSVLFILVLGIIASFGAVRRVLAIDPVQAARMEGR